MGGRVFPGTPDAPGRPIEAILKVPKVPCNGGGCVDKFTLGERSETTKLGRDHLWLPTGTYEVQVTPKDSSVGPEKTVQITTKDEGNVQDIYLAHPSASAPAPAPDSQLRQAPLDMAQPFPQPAAT